MGTLSGAEAVVRMLQLHGVKHIFGLCGDTSLPFYDALHRLNHGMSHILARDERSAAYMADAYARVTGRIGVCEGPSGGGATYLLPGIAEANESSIAMLAITTDISVSSRGKFALTELDQGSLYRPVTKWSKVIDLAQQVPDSIRAAFRAATCGRPGAAHIGLPFDVQKGSVDSDQVWANPEFSTFPACRTGPDPEHVQEVISLFRTARNPLIICGGGPVTSGAFAEVSELSQRISAPVATSISGIGIVPADHPLCIGVVGSNGGGHDTREFIDASDLILFIGCRAGSVTTERWRHPARGKRVVYIDIDPSVIDANYQSAAFIVGDAKLVLRAILDSMDRQDFRSVADPDLPRKCRDVWERRRKVLAEYCAASPRGTEPEMVLRTILKLIPPEATIVADPGTPCPYLSHYLDIRQPGRHYITNRAHGALGYSMAAAIGASVGRPNSRCIAIMGDGSFGFTVGELETVVRYKMPITMIVLSNASFGWIKAGQRFNFEERYFSVDFSRSDHAGIAAAFGIKSWRAENEAAFESALKSAFELNEPTLIDVYCQPLECANAPVTEWIA